MSIAYKNALLGRSINVSGSRDTILVDSNHDVAIISGVISAPNANFSNLTINNSGISVSGHQHNISDINLLQNVITSLSGISPSNAQSTNNLFLWSNFK